MDSEVPDPPGRPADRSVLRVGLVAGVTPDKWVRRWEQRMPRVRLELVLIDVAEQVDAVADGRVTLCFVRDAVRPEGLHLIPLYDEVPVVVVGKEHPVAAYAEIDVADLADETLLQDPDEVPAWREVSSEVRDGTRPDLPALTTTQQVETVAAGTGIVVLPMSVARVHHRKDVVAVPVTGVDSSSIGLAWRSDTDDERVETFIGIVRGRTERSSRGGPDAESGAADRVAGKAKAKAAGARPGRKKDVSTRRGAPAKGRKGGGSRGRGGRGR